LPAAGADPQLHPQRGRNLGVLLMEYFELYGKNFNYARVGISVRDGGYYFPKAGPLV
jgi:non-canonical poly(A) RNA polymerase PAPD5/7